MSNLQIRTAQPEDASEWLRLRQEMWPEDTQGEHRIEIDRFFAGDFLRNPWAVLLAEAEHTDILGFAELSLRPYAEGCTSSPVAYLEGWYVLPEARNQGVGRALVAAAEEWGRGQGCTEFASDTDPVNDVSASAHRAIGFTDAGLVRCFRKGL